MLLRTVSFVGLPLGLAIACIPPFDGDTATETESDVESDGSDVSDVSDTDDASAETGDASSDDTDPDPHTDLPDPDCHLADPMMAAGWTRTYDVVMRGKSGSEHQRGEGHGFYTSQATIEDDGWNVTVRNACDAAGRAQQLGWEGTTQAGPGPGGPPYPIPPQTYTVRATPSAPRAYLPPMTDLRNGLQWSYAYDLRVEDISGSGQFQAYVLPTSGTYTAWPGTQPVTIAGVTYQAFYLTNQYTQELLGMDALGVSPPDNINGHSELWYVEGLGLVKEKTTDLNDPSVLSVEKTLVSFTGLTPVQ